MIDICLGKRLTVGKGRHALLLFKHLHKILFIPEAAGISGFLYADIPVFQQPLRRVDPHPIQVLRKRHSRLFLKQGAEILRVVVEALCDCCPLFLTDPEADGTMW